MDSQYQPDFIVETVTEKSLVEIKDPEKVGSAEVQAKKRVPVMGCHHAQIHAAEHGEKASKYLLIPDDALNLMRRCRGSMRSSVIQAKRGRLCSSPCDACKSKFVSAWAVARKACGFTYGRSLRLSKEQPED